MQSPPLAEVRLWLVRLDQQDLTACLGEAELARAARMLQGGDLWRASRVALRRILAQELACPAERIEFTQGPQGKPSTTGIEFNLSHSGEWALIATSNCPVGVDIERLRKGVDGQRIARRFLQAEVETPEAFFDLWTAREAYVKATGEGIAGQLSQEPPKGHTVVKIGAPAGYAAALAVLAPQVRYSFHSL